MVFVGYDVALINSCSILGLRFETICLINILGGVNS